MTLSSENLYDRARGSLAGGVSHQSRYVAPFPKYVERAQGSRKWEVDGKEFIDYAMGSASLLLGHAHPDVVKALTEQASRGTFFADSHPLEVDWAELIQGLIPCAERVRFVGSGTEATMLAIRIARAAAEAGIATTAIYATDDANSLHVQRADNAVALAGVGPAAYLDIDGVVAAAKEAGADAIHPGYGFLSENAAFAEAAAAAGLTFVGPSPAALGAFGDKANARRLANECNVPVIPGTDGPTNSEEARTFYKELGPGGAVMVKAVAGGGGRGMRPVTDIDQLEDALARCASEAEAAFGDGGVYLERCIQHPRHVEIQVFGDMEGRVVHLGERECSIQRRHQKLIEEAPSPGLSPELRQEMGEAAILAAKSIDYVGAGTVEFLLDKDGSFYFLEMNTRIQVEHAVTEVTTGFDLVKEQIRVAAGEALAFPTNGSGNFHRRGHAIEFRVNAEDPDRNFIPGPGKITTFHPPGGPGIRIDTHVYTGYNVPPYYDSLIAKLIVSGATREEAILRARHSLDQFIIEGIPTTLPFLRRIVEDNAFQEGDINTSFVARMLSETDGPIEA